MELCQTELTITEKDLISQTQLMVIEVKHSRVLLVFRWGTSNNFFIFWVDYKTDS